MTRTKKGDDKKGLLVVVGLLGLVLWILYTCYYSVPPFRIGTVKASNRIYTGHEFLALFSFFTEEDPTHGLVDYEAGYRHRDKLVVVDSNTGHVRIGTAGSEASAAAQEMTVANTSPIPSIRIYTKQTFSGGLFSIELFHVPEGLGVWPAIWFSQDPGQKLPNGSRGTWPDHGEIDLFEQVNNATENSTTLHLLGSSSSSSTENLCRPSVQGRKSPLFDPHCSTQGENPGCGVMTGDRSFGVEFNQQRRKRNQSSAVYTMDWNFISDDKFSLSFYFLEDPELIDHSGYGPFSRSPDPRQWKVQPYGTFVSDGSSRCPLNNLQMIMNITLCGDWAGSVFPCPPSPIGECDPMNACHSFVRTPSHLREAYFSIGRFAYRA